MQCVCGVCAVCVRCVCGVCVLCVCGVCAGCVRSCVFACVCCLNRWMSWVHTFFWSVFVVIY